MKRSVLVLFLVSMSVFVGLTGRMGVRNVAMDALLAEASMILDPVRQLPLWNAHYSGINTFASRIASVPIAQTHTLRHTGRQMQRL